MKNTKYTILSILVLTLLTLSGCNLEPGSKAVILEENTSDAVGESENTSTEDIPANQDTTPISDNPSIDKTPTNEPLPSVPINNEKPGVTSSLAPGGIFGELYQTTIVTTGNGQESVTTNLVGSTIINNKDGSHLLKWLPPAADKQNDFVPEKYFVSIFVNGIERQRETILMFSNIFPSASLSGASAELYVDFGANGNVGLDRSSPYQENKINFDIVNGLQLTNAGTDPEGNPAVLINANSSTSYGEIHTSNVHGDYLELSVIFRKNSGASDGFMIHTKFGDEIKGNHLSFSGLAGNDTPTVNGSTKIRTFLGADKWFWALGDNSSSKKAGLENTPYWNPPKSLGNGWYKWNTIISSKYIGGGVTSSRDMRFVFNSINGGVTLGGVTIKKHPMNAFLQKFSPFYVHALNLGTFSNEDAWSRVDSTNPFGNGVHSYGANDLKLKNLILDPASYTTAINGKKIPVNPNVLTAMFRTRYEFEPYDGNLHIIEGEIKLPSNAYTWSGFWDTAKGWIDSGSGIGEHDFIEFLPGGQYNDLTDSHSHTSIHGRESNGDRIRGYRTTKDASGRSIPDWSHVYYNKAGRNADKVGVVHHQQPLSDDHHKYQAIIGPDFYAVYIDGEPMVIEKSVTEGSDRYFHVLLDSRTNGQWPGIASSVGELQLPSEVSIKNLSIWKIDPNNLP